MSNLFYNDVLDMSSETWKELLLDRNITLEKDLEGIFQPKIHDSTLDGGP